MMACHDAGKQENSSTALYFDYSITATENENAVCMLRYRSGERYGKTVLLDEPSKVELDGQVLKADSASFTGTYYESVQPLQSFIGKHRIVFTAQDKKEYVEDLECNPFELETEMPGEIVKKPFVIRFKNFPKRETQLHLVMIDTSFFSNDVNENVIVKNSELQITEAMLRQLHSGPISMELTWEQSLPLREKTKAGGRFWVSYGLKRDFQLTN